MEPIVEIIVTREKTDLKINTPITGDEAIALTRDVLVTLKNFMKKCANTSARELGEPPFGDEEVYDALIDLIYANRSHTPLENTLRG